MSKFCFDTSYGHIFCLQLAMCLIAMLKVFDYFNFTAIYVNFIAQQVKVMSNVEAQNVEFRCFITRQDSFHFINVLF